MSLLMPGLVHQTRDTPIHAGTVMTLQKTHSFRHLHFTAAIVVAALIAAACGNDPAVEEPATTTDAATTTQPSVAPETSPTVLQPATDAEPETAVETDEPLDTTTMVVEADTGEDASASIEQETEDAPEPEEELVQELELGPDVDSAPDEPLVEPEPEEASQPDDAPASETDAETEDAPLPESETESEPQQAPEGDQATPEQSEGDAAQEGQEDEQEAETTDTTDETDASSEPELSQYQPGEAVNMAELWPDEGYPSDFVCEALENGEFVDDNGQQNCWRTEIIGESDLSQYQPGDVVNMAELLPDEGYPSDFVCEALENGEFVDDNGQQNCWRTEIIGESDLSQYQPGDVVNMAELLPDEGYPSDFVCEALENGEFVDDNGQQNCWRTETQPPSWERGTDDPDSGHPDDSPRETAEVIEWIDWCYSNYGGNKGCEWMLFHMVWALDYLGAESACVLDNYRERIQRGNNPDVAERYHDGSLVGRLGWHKCASVINPIQADGRPLSEHGLTMAERCRAVLPDDVELETGYRRDEIRRNASCNEWGAWVESIRSGASRDCVNSARLAEEWLEHHIGMPELFYNIRC